MSMIDGKLKSSKAVLSITIRKSDYKGDKPWEGIQLIVSGDFFQLPPINAPNPRNEFAFESVCWETRFDIQMELTHVYRRQCDSQLIEFLEGIRRGQVDRDNKNFKRLINGTTFVNGVSDEIDQETRLFPKTDDVKRVNHDRLKSLGKEVVRFSAVDKSSSPWLHQLKYQIAPDELEIYEGARVMLITKIDQAIKLVNGATGVVTGFKGGSLLSSENNPDGMVSTVRFDSGLEVALDVEKWDIMEGSEVKAFRRQVPLILE
ncbi:hypothetical protein ZOSMA_32G00380 [Zostera marina]|uniref:ATP-dependent DNA helicase n=1 Tax=Zostera marina TaxID=29655 RepID=A0A0K9P8F6_ZOSMR|nr:hypothetical protein ZOSMA_32G00380 [Zostera marina]